LGRLDPLPLATHRFALDQIEEAYDVFAEAASSKATATFTWCSSAMVLT
jgi:threonine dehydrogenase-like Zn-dependent dehydrogenase